MRSARLPNGVRVDGDDVWWSEGRPEEGGRDRGAAPPAGRLASTRCCPPTHSARTRVHEYGGGAWWVHDGVLWFADWATQRLHRLEPGGAPVPLTPEPEVPRGLRYADGDLQPDGTTLLCVQEEHHADGREATNTIVRLAAHEPERARGGRRGPGLRVRPALAARRRRVLLARVGPPRHAVGRHPARGRRGRRAHGRGRRRPAGVDRPADVGARRLALVLRRPHRLLEPLPVDAGRAVGEAGRRPRQGHRLPAVGVRPVDATPSSTTVGSCSRTRDGGLERLAVRRARTAAASRTVDVPYTSIDALQAARRPRVVCIAAGATTRAARRRDRRRRRARSTCSCRPRDLGLDRRAGSRSRSRSRSRPPAASTAHALLYPPTNPDARRRRASGRRCS